MSRRSRGAASDRAGELVVLLLAQLVAQAVRGKLAEIHPLMWVVSIGFVVYFANVWIQTVIK